MPEPTNMFEALFRHVPLTEDALDKNNDRLEECVERHQDDIQNILNELDFYSNEDEIALFPEAFPEAFMHVDEALIPAINDNVTIRTELMFYLLIVEALHATRNLIGVPKHPYTLISEDILKTISVKET